MFSIEWSAHAKISVFEAQLKGLQKFLRKFLYDQNRMKTQKKSEANFGQFLTFLRNLQILID